ncbi:axoneme-associated protein mst101(2) isoform X1 [Cydia strobilella]|uniref:axoneme-associated protein mst101(2) isoform X1 n=2 Tax=Cydia strobilella TaxID=1100964 RepID=UPI003007D623
MASTDTSTSSTGPAAEKRTVDEAFLNRLKNLVERLRLENATLKKSLDTERSGIRGLKALHEAAIRNLKTEHRKKEEFLEKQIRVPSKTEKCEDGNRLADCKRLTIEIQSLKAANKGLQEKVKVAQAAECARAAELRAQAAKYAALEHAARKDARAQCHKLLEEIKSKERVIMQLKREAARGAQDSTQAPRMECGAAELSRKLRVDQSKENSDREDLKTDIQHRKETFYREAPPADSAVSSAPASLSPQPLTDMWSCGQCRAAQERAASAARECARLGEQLRDARDQLELMEFRLLELDALPDKARDNLTDSDSGCVSPGSRIKDSASPELKRMDSGYKSPAPSSPHPRRHLATPHDDFKEDFAKAQVLADILDRTSESSDSLRSNPVKEHLEQMILNAGSVEDRNCLEQVLMLLYNLQALSSSVSEDECYQIKPKRICDLKTKQETDITSQKIQKAIATVTPYQQKGYKCESLESLCSDERKPSNVLQESGIFEGVETETRSTQTDVNDSFECSGELNTEIQRLNSIREKLERQGVRNRTLNSKEEGDSLECRCVKLGKKHKQYYERRLKFLEGKISIYEAAQDVKEAKLAQRLQTEFILENRIQELELQLSELQDKYERLEEECCELEEIENDTRLHWQQLEMDYELCSAQLRDMTEQRECSRAQAERLMADLNRNECALKHKQEELRTRLCKLEKAVPALIAWNVINALGAYISPGKERMLASRCPFGKDTRAVINQVQKEKSGALVKYVTTPHDDLPGVADMQEMVFKLLKEKREIENQTTIVTNSLKAKVRELQEELDSTKIQIRAAECRCSSKGEQIQEKISELKDKIDGESLKEELPVDPATMNQIQALLAIEKELKARVAELERRETAYLEMLTQADDMWAEMEGGYKKKIEEAHATEHGLKGQVKKLQDEKDQFKKIIEPLKKTIRELEESDSLLKVALEKSERDSQKHQSLNLNLQNTLSKTQADFKKSETAFKSLEAKFKGEVEQLRRMNKNVEKEMKTTKEASRKTEQKFFSELESVRKELQRACKNHQDLEVTNGELKEEVESLEKQLALTQKALTQCKRKCDEKIKTLSHELSIKTEELEELRSETMRQSFHASRIELKPDRSEYVDEGYSIYTAIPKKTDYDRMHHSMSYITSSSRCSCPAMRSQLVGQLIEDLFDRIHNTVDDDLTRVCKEIKVTGKEMSAETKAKITNYLLMAISKELVRSIGDADAKTDTEEWQRAASTLSLPYRDRDRDRALDRSALGARLEGNAGVVRGAARLASVSCACAAARLAAALPDIADGVKVCQEEVLDHGDVKIMEEQLANAIESIVNCPSCALGTNAIVWSTDV